MDSWLKDQSHSLLLRIAVEGFLHQEALLLDQWRLDEWLGIFIDGASYEVPPAGSGDDADSGSTLFYIADDWIRLKHRVVRLNKETAHSEFPRSICVRLVSNVQVVERDDGALDVRSVFVTYRSKGEVTDRYIGHHRYTLRLIEGALRIAYKRSTLDMENLRPQGRVSIIL
jgi:p-cumate 2,3-dioxygenase beta subunit